MNESAHFRAIVWQHCSFTAAAVEPTTRSAYRTEIGASVRARSPSGIKSRNRWCMESKQVAQPTQIASFVHCFPCYLKHPLHRIKRVLLFCLFVDCSPRAHVRLFFVPYTVYRVHVLVASHWHHRMALMMMAESESCEQSIKQRHSTGVIIN
jgi:hypothetical protein